MYCKNCGTFLNDGARFCPNCGTPVGSSVPTTPQQNYQPAPRQNNYQSASKQNQPAPGPGVYEVKKNGIGLAGFIFSIISLFANYALCIWGILGFIFSIAGMARRKKCNKWNGVTTAGFVINLLSLIGWVIVWIAASATLMALFGLA
ncbi:MAG: zinc-ribbon domain-containing protein [Clostridia bacterium]|nr:zinc-ribbon domain-containing protein [Clostridia bacterium]